MPYEKYVHDFKYPFKDHGNQHNIRCQIPFHRERSIMTKDDYVCSVPQYQAYQ